MFRSTHRTKRTSSRRTGMVLVLVLVVVMVLSFAVYSFCSLMVAEYAATSTGLHHIQRRELINSGIELAALVRTQHSHTSKSSSLPSLTQPIALNLPTGKQATFTLLKHFPDQGSRPEFGVQDESAKLNLNAIPLELSKRKESRRRLMELPGLTLQMADAVLDWMDEDDEPSEFGAETSFYTSQSPPCRPRQGPLVDIEELLKVRGFTPQLLYGEDPNQNGLLDESENDGSANFPPDNSDGILQRGLIQYLTVRSCERVVLSNGRRKINLNQSTLADLYDQLEPILGNEAATYIVAWRMRGATYVDEPRPDQGDDQEQRRLERLESAQKRLEAQLGLVGNNGASQNANQTSRGGLSLTDGAMKFRSLVDLFGGQIQVMIDGKDTLLRSPWPSDPITLKRMLPTLEKFLTTTDRPVHLGRINVNEASEPVLRTIPGINGSRARGILQVQSEIHRTSGSEEFQSVAWLVTRGLLTVPELRNAGPWITTHGDIFSGIAIGQTEGDSAVAVSEFMLDCSGPTRRIMMLRDLPIQSATSLGLKPVAKSSR